MIRRTRPLAPSFERGYTLGLEEKLGIKIGALPSGARNMISDVHGVEVGHVTLNSGSACTGVTAVLPHKGNIYQDKLTCGCAVINGYGKTTGLLQITELGNLETPIVLTNTLSVGTAYTALTEYTLIENPDISSVNPVICECNDSYLNDIRGFHVSHKDVLAALKNTGEDFGEGAVGAGAGMRCHELKGGIGSASRLAELDGKSYCIGCLVLSNHGLLYDLIVDGGKWGQSLASAGCNSADKGSIIVIIATDAPASDRQLSRICRRAVIGLSRTGSYMANNSGEIAIGFSTANRIPHHPQKNIYSIETIHEDKIDILFRAAAEAVEESVLSSLFHSSETQGQDNHICRSLSDCLRDCGDPGVFQNLPAHL